MKKKLDWIEFACEYFNYRFYDVLLEDFTEEEIEKCEEEYEMYLLEEEIRPGEF